MRTMRWGLGAAGVFMAGLLMAGALGAGGSVLAQTPPEDRVNKGERYRELLAAELGVTVDELIAAQTAARNQVIDEAVAAGEISGERAERLKELEPGEGLRLGIGAHMLGHKVHRALFEALEVAADVLDIPVDELRDRLADESLADIASEQGIDEESLQDELVAGLTERINQAVEDGDLSREKADLLIENLDQLVERVVDAEARIGRHFPFGGPRGERFLERFGN